MYLFISKGAQRRPATVPGECRCRVQRVSVEPASATQCLVFFLGRCLFFRFFFPARILKFARVFRRAQVETLP